jgi:hypothetical protein
MRNRRDRPGRARLAARRPSRRHPGRLETQLREDDRLAVGRLREMSADLSDATDWAETANSIARARVARNLRPDGYKPLDRIPDAWPPESLNPANWREAGPPSPNVWPDLRFRRHDAYFGRRHLRAVPS